MLETWGAWPFWPTGYVYVSDMALDFEQKAKFGQKKLALNKTNKSLHELTFFAQLARY